MPGGDRTGPMGQGPATGRRAGYCAGFAVPGHMNPGSLGFGRGGGFGGGGFGRGGGRGYRHRNLYYATGLPDWARGRWGMEWNAPMPVQVPPPTRDESAMLKEQADYFEHALQDIKKRLAELADAGAEGAK